MRRAGRRRAIRALRRLLYCGEWVESHALHVFMLHAPDFLGYQSAFEMAARAPPDPRGRPRAQEGRQRAHAGGRRARDPSDQRACRWLLPRAVARRARGRGAEARGGARVRARGGGLGRRPAVPGARGVPTSSSRWPSPTTYRDRGRPPALERRARPGAARSTRSTSSRSTWSTRPPCTRACARRRRLPGRPDRAVGAARRPALGRRRARRPRRSGSSACARTRSGRSSYAPWRSSTRSTRRSGSSTPTSRRTRRPSRSIRAPASATAGARRRAACSGTATASTRAARSSMRRSSRPPRRTRRGSSRPCAASSSATLDLPDEQLRERCESAIRSYDPCISCSAHFLRLDVDRG